MHMGYRSTRKVGGVGERERGLEAASRKMIPESWPCMVSPVPMNQFFSVHIYEMQMIRVCTLWNPMGRVVG